MGSCGIRHIELCDNCLAYKAEYLLWYFGMFGITCKLLCRRCASLRKGKINYFEERWEK